MKKLVISVMVIFSCLLGMAQQQYPFTLTVALDGTGNYKSIQEAINAFRAYSPVPITLNIKNGVYHEKVTIPTWLTNLTITGESRENTIISYDDYSGKYFAKGSDTLTNKTKMTTFHSYTVWVQGNDIVIKNLTIRNSAGRVGQAVALHVDGDRFFIDNCNLLGNQDTLLTANDNSRQYYLNCFIEGTTDFIFGNATALFQTCIIKSLTNSYITAASTFKGQRFGYIFLDCKLIADTAAKKVFLGRPWRAYAQTVFINTEMGSHILPEGWNNWSNAENEKTAFYAEYNSTGPGATASKRAGWSKQLTAKEAKKYTLQNIFNGWNPGEAK